MELTTPRAIAQACDLMHAHLQGQYAAFARVSASLPMDQYQAMVQAGSHMWALVATIKADALAQEAGRDAGFQAFKAQLLAKPKRARKVRRVAA